ncbi:hypothetical protein AK812_SmicGene43316 [Symbiodinium microadriaticum]|uniref:Uncharacterized protein n=1 Tax=Symbiodinium microadriaticum TaxID=2951 RepID=A0A1Q9C1C2_SYMMI|nr:hypothetical protein AK812_SmicGene43316 [Symbiodinium microadriaticum]
MPNFHTPERGWRHGGQAASSRRVPVEEEARNWVQTMQAMMPKTVTYRRHSDGVEVEWKPQITRSFCQANSCKSLQVLQTLLGGMLGNHGRKSAADMLPSWRRKRWSPKSKRSQGYEAERASCGSFTCRPRQNTCLLHRSALSMSRQMAFGQHA